MTTLQPRKPYTEDELRQLYPAGLELQLVQVLLRHGERTPVSARFQNAGLQPFWPYCNAVRQMRSAVLEDDRDPKKPFSTLEWKRRLEAFGNRDEPVIASGPQGELDAVCDMGMLTDVGRETTYQLGMRLRHLYVDQLKYLPHTIPNADFMYLRATPIPRALESLQQAFSGLYPKSTRKGSQDDGTFPPPTILTRAPADETLFPNDGNCRRFAALSRAFAQRTADRWNTSEDMKYLDKVYGKWMPEDSPRVAVDSHPRLSGIMDTINSTKAHGPETRLPKEFYDEKAHRIIEKIGVEEWFSGYKESREYRMLGIGGLMGDIVSRMVGSAEKTTADGEYELMKKSGQDHTHIRFGMSGCHDTTLAAVLTSLGAFETDRWPPYTSHIAVELFKKSFAPQTIQEAASERISASSAKTSWWASLFSSISPAGKPPPGIGRKPTEQLTLVEKRKLDGYYVRLRYNDEPVVIPGCKTPGKHLEGDESFCTLEAFKAIVDKYTPTNWQEQCSMNRNAPVFPAQPEPAGH